MRLYLGIDGGGTKTATVIVEENGRECGRGIGGSCNIATAEEATLRRSIEEAVGAAMREAGLAAGTPFAGVCAGVAGYTARRQREEFARLLPRIVPAERHRLEPDFVIAYWGASAGEPGVIVLAGTGAVLYGRNAAGETCREDGRGFLLGDRGSGFWLGTRALQHTLQQMESDAPPDRLARRVLAEIGAQDADDLIQWVYRDFQPIRVARLAALVGSAAQEEDPYAQRLLNEAVEQLGESARRVLARLSLPPGSAPIFPLGGLWNIHPGMKSAFARLLCARTAAPVTLREPLYDPAYGAALLALRG
jgi:N-acetylglucosamine kinase-like BadF-type ATPase